MLVQKARLLSELYIMPTGKCEMNALRIFLSAFRGSVSFSDNIQFTTWQWVTNTVGGFNKFSRILLE